jgi:hypothetical protein
MTSAPRGTPLWPEERPPAWAPMASAAAFIVYALAIPALISVGFAASPSWTGASVVLLAVSVYSAVRISLEIGNGASRWFVLVFHTFTYVFLGVVPLVQIGTRTLLWTVDPAPDVLLSAAFVCLAGVLSFDAGLWLGLSRSARHQRRGVDRFPRIQQERPDPGLGSQEPRSAGFSARAANRALAFLLGLTILSLVIFLMRDGLALVLASRSEMEAALCSGQSSGGLAECGVVSGLVRVPPVLLTVVAVGMRDRGHSSLTRLAIFTGIVALFLTANPVSAARFWVGAASIGVLGATLMRSIRARVLIWLALPALLIVLFPILDFGRDRGWSADFSIRLEVVTQKQDFDAFQQITNGITYVDVYGTRDGSQLASALLFFVPRSVWTDKAPATGPLVATTLGVTDNTNVSAPLWEEAYVDFGFAGVLALMSALGFAVARLEAAVDRSLSPAGGLTVVVAPFFAGYGVFLLRGALLPAIGLLAVAILLVLIISRFGSAPRPLSGGHSSPPRFPVQPRGSLREPPDVPPRGADGLVNAEGRWRSVACQVRRTGVAS